MGKQFYSVAIDGPAGAGKSTMARILAQELGFVYVDTGAIYRSVAYFLALMGISPKDTDGVTRLIDEINLQITYDETGAQRMILNGLDISGEIRTPEISKGASLASAQKVVRSFLLEMQREVARRHNVIMDGRDIGTVVLPKADVKIYLTASAEIRAERRYAEMLEKGQKADFKQVLQEIVQRDQQDMTRAIAPLKMAADAVKLDTSDLDIAQSVAQMKDIIARSIPL